MLLVRLIKTFQHPGARKPKLNLNLIKKPISGQR